jgi:hypothetical protein
MSTFLAVVTDDAHERAVLVAVDDVVGAEPLTAVHAHVQGRVAAVREPTVHLVELRGRHSEVHQHGTHSLVAEVWSFTNDAFEIGEAGSHDVDAVAERGEPFGRCGDGDVVAVDAEQLQPGVRGEDGRCVAAAAEGRVDVEAVGNDREQLDDAVEEDRDVVEGVIGHLAPPA